MKLNNYYIGHVGQSWLLMVNNGYFIYVMVTLWLVVISKINSYVNWLLIGQSL